MSIGEKTRRSLEEIGLTEYETKTYLSLLNSSPAVASSISRDSGVPYSKIYDVLSSLESKGWVEVEHTRPSKFYPRSPATAMETMKMKWESEWVQNESQVLNELLAVYEKRGAKERPETWIVRGEYNILTKVRETLSNCKQEVLLAVPVIFDSVLNMASPLMIELKGRGVKVSILSGEDVSDDTLTQMSRWGELKTRQQMFGGGVIADASEVIILLAGGEEGDSTLAIWSDHLGLARFAKNYFEYLWNDSEPYRGNSKR